MSKIIKIGFLGCGNVGGGVWRLLNDFAGDIEHRTGLRFEVRKVLVRNVNKARGIDFPEGVLTDNVEDVLGDPEIEVVLEFLGGEKPACDYLLEALCLLDPLEGCRVVGDRREWEKLPPEKSLFHAKPGCGLPIGNLSSQLFSNVYLGALDDFMKRELGCRHYGRYVDDAYVAGESREALWALVPRVRAFLREELGLELNEGKVRVTDAYRGVEFVGAFVKPHRTYPAARALRRIRGRMRSLDWSEGPGKVQARVNSMLGVLSHFDCWHVRRVLVQEAGLRRMGEVSEDCLRFWPDAVEFWKRDAAGSRIPQRGRDARAPSGFSNDERSMK